MRELGELLALVALWTVGTIAATCLAVAVIAIMLWLMGAL